MCRQVAADGEKQLSCLPVEGSIDRGTFIASDCLLKCDFVTVHTIVFSVGLMECILEPCENVNIC